MFFLNLKNLNGECWIHEEGKVFRFSLRIKTANKTHKMFVFNYSFHRKLMAYFFNQISGYTGSRIRPVSNDVPLMCRTNIIRLDFRMAKIHRTKQKLNNKMGT